MEKEFIKTLRKLYLPIGFVAILVIIHLCFVFGETRLGLVGVVPRKSYGLWGIITGPLVHSNVQHLMANLFPLAGLMSLLFIFYRKISYFGFALIYVLTGVVVWLFARQVSHVGASGIVYGLVSFVFFNGIFRKNLLSIILALIVTMLYIGSGYFMGILPNQEGISWESHLFGALVGVFVSFVLKDIPEAIDKEHEKKEWAEEETRYYLPRDTFDMTKQEREMLRQQQELIRRQEEMLRRQQGNLDIN